MTDNQRMAYIARTDEVTLTTSLESLDQLIRLHYSSMALGFPQDLPVSREEFVEYCKSIVSYKLKLVSGQKLATGAEASLVRNALKSATLPCFLESLVERLGRYYDESTGVLITWEAPEFEGLKGHQLADISLRLSSVRHLNVDLAFNAVSLSEDSEFDNAYIVDQGYVWSLNGVDIKGYQMAAALGVMVKHEAHRILFRKNLCSQLFARQEVVNGFGH